jgi:hypothetical protein
MYKVMAFISRKPGMSAEAFRDYYERVHTGVVGSVAPPMKAYRRNYVNFAEPFRRSEEQIDFDVITEMEFEDRAACESWFNAFRNADASERVSEDEAKFLDRDRVRVCVVETEETDYSAVSPRT